MTLKTKLFHFVQKYPILGIKYKDFIDFSEITKLMKVKAHLTKEGFDQIKKIKAGMNKTRKFF